MSDVKQQIIPTEELVVDSSSGLLMRWRDLWRYRELFYFFAWRDIKVKYKQTTLGVIWIALQPLLMMLIFTLFFGKALNIPSQNLPYPVFVFSGMLIWNVFSGGIISSSSSMVNNAQIIKKIYFPRLIIPASSVLVVGFDFVISILLFGLLLLYYQQSVLWSAFVYWPMALLVAMLATLGPGSLLAALNVKYRDFRYVIPFLVQMMFFLAPVLYPSSMLSNENLRLLSALSPIYAALELFRYPLTGEWHFAYMLLSLCSVFLVLFVGLIYFRSSEDFFADYA